MIEPTTVSMGSSLRPPVRIIVLFFTLLFVNRETSDVRTTHDSQLTTHEPYNDTPLFHGIKSS